VRLPFLGLGLEERQRRRRRLAARAMLSLWANWPTTYSASPSFLPRPIQPSASPPLGPTRVISAPPKQAIRLRLDPGVLDVASAASLCRAAKLGTPAHRNARQRPACRGAKGPWAASLVGRAPEPSKRPPAVNLGYASVPAASSAARACEISGSPRSRIRRSDIP
jgi:hypothetical protein